MVAIESKRQKSFWWSCLVKGKTIFYIIIAIALLMLVFLKGFKSDDRTSSEILLASGNGNIRSNARQAKGTGTTTTGTAELAAAGGVAGGSLESAGGMPISNDALQPLTSRGTTQVCATAIMPLYWDEDAHIDKVHMNPACPNPNLMVGPVHVSKEKILTYFITYYNAADHLTQQLHSWMKFSDAIRQRIQFLIVDDASAAGFRAVDVLKANTQQSSQLDIHVYEIDQDIPWNIGGARNLGVYMAPTDWVFISDADIIVRPETMEQYIMDSLLERGVNKKTIFRNFHRLRADRVTTKAHPEVMLVSKSAYWLAGGCDEDFVGHYGYTGEHFFYRAEKTKRLDVIHVEDEMKNRPVLPLEEMSAEMDCSTTGMICLGPYTGPTPSKDPKQNAKIMGRKQRTSIVWSKQYLRFTWRRVW